MFEGYEFSGTDRLQAVLASVDPEAAMFPAAGQCRWLKKLPA